MSKLCRRPLAVAASTLLTMGTLGTAAASGSPASPPGRASAAGVQANLFEWNWPSVARECTHVLGPAGYAGVQVAPPQDSTRRTVLGDGSDTVLHPWWEAYQPVSYSLNSRMGTEAQFKQMVGTCRRAGVKVYVDTILNHMTGQGTTSYAGAKHTKYSYRGLYSAKNFHAYPKACPVKPGAGTKDVAGSIADFNDYRQVFDCELVGLSDLDTSQPYVRKRLAGYLNKLLSYGVSGFRVDAAKHVGQRDLNAVFRQVHRTVDGSRPRVWLEVMPGGPGRLAPKAFLRSGDLLGFDYANQLHDAFASYNNPPNDGNIGSLKGLGPSSGLLPSAHELVFVENHDTERNGSTLNYKAPNNVLANQFMLAYGHGTPQVYSGFAWKTSDDSPPADSTGRVTNTRCNDGTWVCVDRYRQITALVGFHNAVGDAPVSNWYDDGANAIGFSRGDRGYFAGNNTAERASLTVDTGLRPGSYRDRVSGSVVRVGRDGRTTLTVPAYGAVALTR